ncbi:MULTISPECIES: SDR family NAD(P)-dependent oxidoreductase [unclassified Streptomyces]|uniref:SDR family NAD(P)-dependent oxidoreductase n=1 Tax=unclassified Streptomyces TaxID=2593676 RepID=UPI002E13D348|nr:SDR family oxidoreductase [Streptomyces sp. NBC_01296]WSW62643.1 SDR family oxidoreductase [Streptomyces sp. NBC_00998]
MNAVDYRGRTTLITGASSGLGAEFARQLAARGSDLVLVARREDRLKELAGQLSAAHGVAVEPIAMDLSVDGSGELLAAEVDRRGITVSSVINNAGFGTYGRFHEEDAQRLRQEVGLDVMAVVDISRAFIGRLRSRGEGVLLNVASMAGYQPVPNMAVYGAGKAFVLSFTEALWQESHGTGLRVMALSPGATKTEFFDVVGSEDAAGGTRMQTSEVVVRTALKALDRKNPPPSVISGGMNRVMAFSGRLASRRMVVRVVDRISSPRTP